MTMQTFLHQALDEAVMELQSAVASYLQKDSEVDLITLKVDIPACTWHLKSVSHPCSTSHRVSLNSNF